MATSMELSPQNVVTALQDLSVEKTTELVFHLSVEIKVLDDIALQYSGISRKIHSIQAWLDSDTSASWEKLASGLKQIGMTVVAERVESTFVPQVEVPVTVCTSVPVSSASVPPVQAVSSPAPRETVHVTPVPAALIPASVQPCSPGLNPSKPPAVSTDRIAEIKAAIEQFEEEFADIKADTRSSLTEKESQDPKFLHRFCNYLLELPVAKKAIHAKFCTGLVRTAITPDFARVHHLTEVTVDGVHLAITEIEREKLVCYHSLLALFSGQFQMRRNISKWPGNKATFPTIHTPPSSLISPLHVVLSTYCSVCV